MTTSESSISLPRAVSMYLLTSVFLFFEMALQVSPSVMASQLIHDLNLSAFALGIMSGCYFYTYTFMQLPSGLLFDRFNPKRLILLAIIVCTLGNFLLSMAPSLIMACLARLLMGMGSAFAFVSVLVVTKDLFDSRWFALMTGITQALAAIGAMSGQLPISVLVQTVGWRHALMCLSGFGVLLAVLVWVFFNYQKATQAPDRADARSGFKRIFRNHQTWLVALYAMLMWAPMSGFTSLWGVPYLEQVYHLSSTCAAFICSLMWLGLAIASPLLGHLSTASRTRKWPLMMAAVLGAVAFGCVTQVSLHTSWLMLSLLLAGGACSGQALTFSVVKENNEAHVAATAIAFNNMAVVISGALFQPLMGWVVSHAGGTHAHNMQVAMFFVLGAYVVAALIALFGIRESFEQQLAA